MNNNYFRKFLTLAHENGQRGKSFGTLILERRNNINKITLNISNIRPNLDYCLTLVKVFENNAKFVDIKTFKSDEYGNVSIKSEIDNKMFQNIEIDTFDVCLIRINTKKELITPLVAYFGANLKWREFYIPLKEDKTLEEAKKVKEVKVIKDEEYEPMLTKPYNFGFNTSEDKNYKPVHEQMKNQQEKLENIKEKTNQTEAREDIGNCSSCPNNNVLSKAYSLKDNKGCNRDNKEKEHKEHKPSFPNIKPLRNEDFLLDPVDDCDEPTLEALNENVNSSDMIEKLKEEIENLKNIAIRTYEKDTKSAFENIELLPSSIDELFMKSEKIEPFNIKGKQVEWVIIDFSDLILIDNIHMFSKNPFFINSYKKFSHFILGKYTENEKNVYLIGVPDFFDHEYEKNIRDLGFVAFKEALNGIQQGYWLTLV